MDGYEVDDVDRAILYQLQRDARLTATEIGDRVGVSDTTVRNRMKALREEGVVESYTAVVNYERAGLQRPFHFTCTVPIIEREEVAKGALDVPGVVSVTERMTGEGNLLVEAVGEHPDDVTRVARLLTELGARIVDETVVRSSHRRPLAYLDSDFRPEDEADDREG
jgi:DNA-binding Lrp family transcriptional regulator